MKRNERNLVNCNRRYADLRKYFIEVFVGYVRLGTLQKARQSTSRSHRFCSKPFKITYRELGSIARHFIGLIYDAYLTLFLR